jgi:hypothetical protein
MSFPHLNIDEATRTLMSEVATCRDANCAVPQKHPFYPTPEQPPLFYGKTPCMPVVPTNLAMGKVMIIGEYPNCRFTSITPPNPVDPLERFIPIADIAEPFEGGRYYDGYSIRNYPTEFSLQMNYLEPLGLNLREDVWLTNVIKCFLMRPVHITDYQTIGWNDPAVSFTYDKERDYLNIASTCVTKHLVREVQKCQPKLIIALGEKAYRMLHASNNFTTPAPDIRQADLVGNVFKANEKVHPLDRRDTFFLQYNVAHLYHPSFFARPGAEDELITHKTIHIVAVKTFLDSLNLF